MKASLTSITTSWLDNIDPTTDGHSHKNNHWCLKERHKESNTAYCIYLILSYLIVFYVILCPTMEVAAELYLLHT